MDEYIEHDRAKVKARQDHVNRLIAVLLEVEPEDRWAVLQAAQQITCETGVMYGPIGPGRPLRPVRQVG